VRHLWNTTEESVCGRIPGCQMALLAMVSRDTMQSSEVVFKPAAHVNREDNTENKRKKDGCVV
jgi:hypothetical protein